MVNAWSLLYDEIDGTLNEEYPIMTEKNENYDEFENPNPEQYNFTSSNVTEAKTGKDWQDFWKEDGISITGNPHWSLDGESFSFASTPPTSSPDSISFKSVGPTGFLSFSFVPGLGLPAELPAAAAGDLLARQAWWLGTAVASCIGLAIIAFGKSHAWRAAGLLVLVIPHAIGAPHAEAGAVGAAPPELAAQYIMVTLFASAIMWSILGLMAAYVHGRLAQDQTVTFAEPHVT